MTFILSIQLEMFKLVGLKDAGLEALHPPDGSHPFQLDAVHPGSPSWK